MKLSKYRYIIFVLSLAAVVRLFPLNLPFLATDEARIAFRGYTLSHFGTDELGRKFPLIFNSTEDYQLPITSYLEALSIGVFGKTDLGARLPFIAIGILIVWLSYLVASVFNPTAKFKIITSL